MAEAQPDMWYDRSPLLDDRHGRALINGVTKEVDIFLKSYKRAKGANDAGYFSTANEDRKRVIVACGRLVELRPKFELRNQLIFDTVVDSTNKALEKHPVFPMPLNNNADALENFCQRIQARRSSSAAGVPEVGTPATNSRRAASTKSSTSTRQQELLRRSFQHLRAARDIHGSSRGSIRSVSVSGVSTDGISSYQTVSEAENVTAEVDETLRAAPSISSGAERKKTSGSKTTSETHSTIKPKAVSDVPVASTALAVDSTGGNASVSRTKPSSVKSAAPAGDETQTKSKLESPVASTIRVDDHVGGPITSKTPRQCVGGRKSQKCIGTKENGRMDRVKEPLATPGNPDGGVVSAAEAVKTQTMAIKQRQQEIQAGKIELEEACRVFASFLGEGTRQLDKDRENLQVLVGDLEEGIAPESDKLQEILLEHEREQEDSVREWVEQNPAPFVTVPITPPLPQPTLLSPAAQPFEPHYDPLGLPINQPQPTFSTPHSFPNRPPPPPYSTQFLERKNLYANKATRVDPRLPISTEPNAAAAIGQSGGAFAAPGEENESVYYAPSVRDGDDIYGSSVGQNLLRLTVANSAREFLISNRPKGNEKFTGDGDKVDFENTLNRFNLVTSQEGVTDLQRFMELRHYFAGSAGTVCGLYERNRDPAAGLSETLKHLKRNFGRRNVSAQRMLDELLQGKQIEKSDAIGLQSFVLKLETTYQRAVETNRHSTFNSQDTINQIIRKRVKSLAVKWGQRRARKRLTWNDDDEDETEPTFVEFLDYLKQQNLESSETATILGKTEAAPKEGESKQKGKAPMTAKINAASASTGQPAKASKAAPATGAKRGAPGGGRGRGRGLRGAGRGGYMNMGERASSPSQPSSFTAASKAPAAPKALGEPAKKDTSWICVSCEGVTYHQLDVCPNFSERPSEEKFSLLKLAGKCLLCLGHGHIARDCTSTIRCNCGGKHHPCMCRGDAPTRGASAGKEEK